MQTLNKVLSWTITACLILASCYLIQAFYIHAKASMGQWLIEQAWEKSLQTRASEYPWPWADTYPVGKLSVPSLSEQQYILHGSSGEALAFGPGMSVFNDVVGSSELTLIQAHRDTHFSFLVNLKVGDKIQLDKIGKKVDYQVVEIQVVDTPELQIDEGSSRSLLILTTCHPYSEAASGVDSSTHRFVVVAERVS